MGTLKKMFSAFLVLAFLLTPGIGIAGTSNFDSIELSGTLTLGGTTYSSLSLGSDGNWTSSGGVVTLDLAPTKFILTAGSGDMSATGFTVGTGDITFAQGGKLDGDTNNEIRLIENSDTLKIGFSGDDITFDTTDGGFIFAPTDATDGTVDFMTNNDTDDYIQISTGTNQPVINFVGCNGKITAASGTIDFDNENLTTTGTLTVGAFSLTSLTLTNGETVSNGTDGTLTVSGNASGQILDVLDSGTSNSDATLSLSADAAADNGDVWRLTSDGGTNSLFFENNTSGSQATIMSLTTNGILTLTGALTLSNSETISNATDATIRLTASGSADPTAEVYSGNTTDGDSTLLLTADADADAGDRMAISHDGATNSMLFMSDTSSADTLATIMTLAKTGLLTLTGNLVLANAEVISNGTDAEVRVAASGSGNTVLEVYSPNATNGTSTLRLTADAAGDNGDTWEAQVDASDNLVFQNNTSGSQVAKLTIATTGAVTAPGIINLTNTTDASNLTTASVIMSGGLAVTKQLYLGDDIDLSVSGTGVYDITLKDAVADALSIVRGSTDVMVFDTATPKITITPVVEITGAVTLTGGAVLQNGELITNATNDTLRVASNDSSFALDVYSPNATNGTAALNLIGDAGADATDRFQLKNNADGTLLFGNDSSAAGTYLTKLTLSSAGVLTFVDSETLTNASDVVTLAGDDNDTAFAVKGFEAKDAYLRLTADEGDEATDSWQLESDQATGSMIIGNDSSVAGTYVTKLTLASTGLLTMVNGETINNNTTDDTITIASDDADLIVKMYSPKATDGTMSLQLVGDAGADATDGWQIQNSSAGTLLIGNDSSAAGTYLTKLTLASTGVMTMTGALTLSNGDTIANAVDDTIQVASDDTHTVFAVYSGFATNGTAAITLVGDAQADVTDSFRIKNNANGTMTFGNDSAVAGTYVDVTTMNSTGDWTFGGVTPYITIGDAAEEDCGIIFDGHSGGTDWHITLDDSGDELEIGVGTAPDTTTAITIASATQITTFAQDILVTGTTPLITIGDAGDEDAGIQINSDTNDYYIASENSADTLIIGVGSAIGTTPAITVASTQNVTLAADLIMSEGAGVIDFSGNTSATISTSSQGVGIVLDAADEAAGTAAKYVEITGTTPAHGAATPTDIWLDISPTIGIPTVATNDHLIDLTFTSPAWATAVASNVRGIYIAPTIGNATLGTNGVNGLEIANITGDAEVDVTGIKIGTGTTLGTSKAIVVGTGWDAGLEIASPVSITSTITGDGGDALYGFLHSQVASTTTSVTAAQAGVTFVSNSADVMTLPEASTVLGARYTFICGTADDFDINPADGTDTIAHITASGGTITPAAGDAIRITDIGSSVTLEAIGNDTWACVAHNGVITDVN